MSGKKLFGTDGIRGVANEYPMTADMALKVGRAAGHIFRKDDRPHTILIGKDTRISGYLFENALTAGLCSMGMHVLVTGPLPTPGVSYIMRSLRCDAAIMISASHNSYHDNGIKFFGPDGYKIADELEAEIERLIVSGEIDDIKADADTVGSAKRIEDARGRYIEFAKASFPKGMRLDGLKVVVDSANGAAYRVGPAAMEELGAEVITINDKPDGRNINANCGSVHPEEMRATVIREKADVGISFDGDGDRLVMADSDGRLLDGNAVLSILAVDMIERGILPKKTLVTTIMANAGLQRAIEPLGGDVVSTKVGDRFVVEAMREHGLTLGGEGSGHIILMEHNVTGDALISGLQMLAIMVRKNQPLSHLAQVFVPMPEIHRKVALNGRPAPSQDALNGLKDEAEAALSGTKRIVLRPSGTEPIVRVMVQNEALRDAESMADTLAEKIAAL
jgi:phosphoglucosamine mutase